MARPALIDRSSVVSAALELADERGLDAVTMQAVARHLGVTPMALYRHVEHKDDLLDALVERLLSEVPAPDPALAWQERLGAMGRSVREVAHRHPHVFPLLLQRPAATVAARESRDRVIAAIVEGGADRAAAGRIERVVSSMILGFTASEASGRFREHSRDVVDADYALLERLVAAALSELLTESRDERR